MAWRHWSSILLHTIDIYGSENATSLITSRVSGVTGTPTMLHVHFCHMAQPSYGLLSHQGISFLTSELRLRKSSWRNISFPRRRRPAACSPSRSRTAATTRRTQSPEKWMYSAWEGATTMLERLLRTLKECEHFFFFEEMSGDWGRT